MTSAGELEPEQRRRRGAAVDLQEGGVDPAVSRPFPAERRARAGAASSELLRQRRHGAQTALQRQRCGGSAGRGAAIAGEAALLLLGFFFSKRKGGAG